MSIHDGHRSRLRERFRREGLDGFSPHEVLELLLCYGRARGDVNPLAHRLLDSFGSLKGVLEASPQQLMAVEGVGEETATLLALAVPLFRRYQACLLQEKKQLNGTHDAAAFCAALLAGKRSEQFYVVSLSAKNRVVGVRRIAEGTLDEVYAYPRLVVETALNHNAHGVVLCHNHPSGDCTPSAEDLRLTQRLHALLLQLDIRLLDHIVVGDGVTHSMAEHQQLKGAGK